MREPGVGTSRARAVRSVHGEELLIERSGRILIDIEHIELGKAGCSIVVGPNGAGKSLLVRTLCALIRPDRGRVFWSGTAPDAARRHRVGLLLQRPVLLRRSALRNVMYALQMAGASRREAKQQAGEALEGSGLSAICDVAAHRLSGGEQQRVALTRALALKPDMLFLDEATANVDPASTQVIEQQLLGAMQAGLQVVMVSHDMGQVRRLADEVILMNKGRIVEQSPDTFFFEHTQNPVSLRWLAGDLLV